MPTNILAAIALEIILSHLSKEFLDTLCFWKYVPLSTVPMGGGGCNNLQDLLKHTWKGHPDYENLQEGVETLRSIGMV